MKEPRVFAMSIVANKWTGEWLLSDVNLVRPLALLSFLLMILQFWFDFPQLDTLIGVHAVFTLIFLLIFLLFLLMFFLCWLDWTENHLFMVSIHSNDILKCGERFVIYDFCSRTSMSKWYAFPFPRGILRATKCLQHHIFPNALSGIFLKFFCCNDDTLLALHLLYFHRAFPWNFIISKNLE